MSCGVGPSTRGSRRIRRRRVTGPDARVLVAAVGACLAETGPPSSAPPAGAGSWRLTGTGFAGSARRPTCSTRPETRPSAGDPMAMLLRAAEDKGLLYIAR